MTDFLAKNIFTHNTLKIKTTFIFRYAIISLLFLIGGTIQYFSILSITKTNLLIVLIIFSLLFTKCTLRNIIKSSLTLWPLLLYLIFLFLVSQYHENSSIIFLAFSLSSIFPLLTFLYVQKIICENADTVNATINFFYVLLILQLPVLLLQSLYFDFAPFVSPVGISSIDIRFGTFFMKSDSTVGLFVNLLLLYSIFKNDKKKITVTVLYFLSMLTVILLIHSVLSKIVFLFILLIYLINNYLKINKLLMASIFFSLLSIAIFIIFNLDLVEYYKIIIHERSEIINEIDRFHPQVPRYAVIIMLFNKVSLLGNGLFDYYNYLTKEWNFFAGHSLWFSLYNDTGPIGVLLIILFYWKVFLSQAKIKLLGFAHFSLAVFYSSISFLLYDIGALLLLATFSYINNINASFAHSQQDKDVID